MHERFGDPRTPFPTPALDEISGDRWAVVNQSFVPQSQLDIAERNREEFLKMDDPVDLEQALGQFGMALGVLPAAALFYRLIFLFDVQGSPVVVAIAVLMLFVSLFVGRHVGMGLTNSFSALERFGWPMLLAGSVALGLLWGLATGGASGVLAFGIGAPFGAILGAVVGATAFPIFISLHRILSQDGKIEASLLRPISFGVAAVISGFILGL